MNHIGLFEGIGACSLAARWMGWHTIAWCEWGAFGQRVLRHHYPAADGHGDITKTDFTPYAGRTDILTGGDPCQPHSVAGKRKGTDDERFLWPEMLRAARETEARWVVNENVVGSIDNGVVDRKIGDLEAAGYTCWPPLVIAANALGANHERQRVFIVAHSERPRLQGHFGTGQTLRREPGTALAEYGHHHVFARDYEQLSRLEHLREPDGLPLKVLKQCIHAFGNALLPEIPYAIYQAIEAYESLHSENR